MIVNRVTSHATALGDTRQQELDPLLQGHAVFERANAYPENLGDDEDALRRHLCSMFLMGYCGENQFLDLLTDARLLKSMKSVMTFYARGVLSEA